MVKVTIKDVAKRAGVSLSTVSRVLNRNPNVDAALAEKVLSAARELGYRAGASHTAAQRPGQIALILPELRDSYYTSIAAGVIDTAHQNGQNVVVMQTNADRDTEAGYVERLLNSDFDGIIFAGNDGSDLLERFPALTCLPIVVAVRRQVLPGVPHVYSDNVSTGYMATKYLLRLRRRKIALMVNFWTNDIRDYETFLKVYNSPAQGACTAFDRYTGYCQALAEEGLEVDPELILFSGFTHEAGYASAQELLSRPRECDAVLVSNDRCATGVLRLFREQGINVPDQVSIICFNGGLMSNVVIPSLTMIQQNNYDVGVHSAQQLNELLHGRPAHDVKIDVSLVIKGSTALAGQST